MKGDAAQQKEPAEQEMDRFKGFSTLDGEVANGEATPEEKKALADRASEQPDEEPADEEQAIAEKDEEPADAEAEDKDKDDVEDDEESPEAVGQREAQKLKGKGKKAINRRIADYAATARIAERRAAAAEQERVALAERIAVLESRLTPQQDATKKEDKRPDPADFEYGELDTRFVVALTRYEARQAYKEEAARDVTSRKSQAAQRDAAEDGEKLKAFLDAGGDKFDDFDEVVVESALRGEWPLPDALGKLAVASEHGHDILYHLASNPKEALQIAGKSPMEQAAYFGRLEAKFAATSAVDTSGEANAKPVKTTKAPQPVQKARGAGGKFQVSSDTPDFAQFEAMAMGGSKH
jgi:hypothetical protein